MRQGLGHGTLHDPFQTPELRAVDGQLIVLHQAPIFLLELGDDGINRIIDAFPPVDRLASLEIGTTFGLNDPFGHSQSNLSVDTAVSTPVMLVISLFHRDLVAEEPRTF